MLDKSRDAFLRKRNWIVQVPGHKPFPMVIMDGPLTQSEALIEARKIWPNAELVEVRYE